MKIIRGQIYYANLEPVIGSEQGGVRPVVILQNDIGNRHSPTVIVAPLTNEINSKRELPVHVKLMKQDGIKSNSIILLEQIRVIDKCRLNNYISSIRPIDLQKVNKAISLSLNL